MGSLTHSIVKEKTMACEKNDNDELQCRKGWKRLGKMGDGSSGVMKYKNKPTLEREQIALRWYCKEVERMVE